MENLTDSSGGLNQLLVVVSVLGWSLASALEDRRAGLGAGGTIKNASAGLRSAHPLDDDALGELLERRGIGFDLNAVAPEIEPVLDALIRQAPRTALQQAAVGATEAVWSDELEAELAQELQEFREQALDDDPELMPRIDAALAELARPPRQNHVAHALVWRAALELMRRANRNYERMAELEQTLAEASPAAHRHLTLPVAAAASLAVDVGDLEAAKAITEFVVSLPSDPERDARLSDASAAAAVACEPTADTTSSGCGSTTARTSAPGKNRTCAHGLGSFLPTDRFAGKRANFALVRASGCASSGVARIYFEPGAPLLRSTEP